MEIKNLDNLMLWPIKLGDEKHLLNTEWSSNPHQFRPKNSPKTVHFILVFRVETSTSERIDYDFSLETSLGLTT